MKGRISSGQVAAARRIELKRGRFVLGVLAAVALCTASAAAQASTFSYTGGEQKFVVPAGDTAVEVVATGAQGGGPVSCCLQAGSGAVVSGVLKVTPGEALYVEVGGTGGLPAGGFNGGGMGGTDATGLSEFGGGGASDVRVISSSAGGSLASRLLVAAGGGGSGRPGAAGGDAGAPGGSSPGSSVGGGAGTLTAGGAGGCDPGFPNIGCGQPGSLGIGGDGGESGEGASGREGSGGGGGLYGGGGGAGVMGGDAVSGGEVGGGGGGSSLTPAGGALTLAPLTTPPSVVITTGPPRKTAAVAITRIRATPVSPGCATETGTKERETRAGAADATCRHFRLTVRGAIRVGGRLAPTASGRVTVTATAMLPRGETMRAAQGSLTRGGWRVSLILPGINLDPLPPRYLLIVRYHGDDTIRQASAARHIRIESERAAL